MIGTNFSYEQYEKRRIERHKAQGLRFVPEGDVPKVYCVVCANASDWNEIHNYIINENEIDGIPNRKIECTNLKKTCDRIGSYEISDAEAEQLRNHPKVIGVNIDEGYYEGTYKGRDTYPTSEPTSKTSRYSGNVKISRDNSTSGFYNGTDSTWLSKTCAQIYRHQTLDNPWKNQNDDTLITDNPEQFGDGTDVDVIVCDTSAWFGHIEFVKTGVGEPSNYIGGNVLKSGFSSSATTGVCGALDVILQGPYYLDPDFFEADTSNRLRVRWDGTTVPVDTVATDWWYDETKRSAKFCPVGSTTVDGDAGTAVANSNEDFGSIYVASQYTETLHNGSNTALHTGEYDGAVATHGTPCMSQAYGKTHGWAYNANKWFISIIWANGAINTSSLWEVIKVFHDNKPNRSSDNTKNPTITSHSWGSQTEFFDGEYSYFRTSGDGTGEESISITQSTGAVNLEWLDNFDGNRAQYYVDGVLQPARGKHSRWYPTSNSTQAEGAAMIDSGVIFMASSGNNNQQQVKGDHPNYNNYVSTSASRTLASAESLGYEMVNRPGNPSCIGNVNNYNGGGIDVYRSFNVGALDDDTVANGDGTYQEQKATYSNMGNAVDFYTIGDGSIGAKGGPGTGYDRNDSSYRLDSNYNIVSSGGTLSLTSQDRFFNGTSSACPVGAGLFATKLQNNRTWTWSNLKDWLANNVTDQSNDDEFFQGTEATTSNSSNWNSTRNLQGGSRKILWDAAAPSSSTRLFSISGRLLLRNDLTIGLDPLLTPLSKVLPVTSNLELFIDPATYTSGTTVPDSSGNNRTYDLVNGVVHNTSPDRFTFDGTNDYMEVSTDYNISTVNATFIAWIKRNGGQDTWAGIMFNRNYPGNTNAAGMNFRSNTSDLGYHFVSGTMSQTWGWASGLSISDATWTMCAVTVNATTVKAYLFTSSSTPSTASNNPPSIHSSTDFKNIRLGRDAFSESRSYKGDIGHSLFYSSTLTDSEIIKIYNATKSRYGY